MTTNYKVETTREGDWFINVQTVRRNNGLPNQSYYLCINANILTVRRVSDGKQFTCNNTRMYVEGGRQFYATHFWINSAAPGGLSVAGYYTKQKEPYSDETIRTQYFSCNICSINDLK